jgi:hypothetical protein
MGNFGAMIWKVSVLRVRKYYDAACHVIWEVSGPAWTVGSFAIVIRDTYHILIFRHTLVYFTTWSKFVHCTIDLWGFVSSCRCNCIRQGLAWLHCAPTDPLLRLYKDGAPLRPCIVVAVGVYVVVFVVPLSICGSSWNSSFRVSY